MLSPFRALPVIQRMCEHVVWQRKLGKGDDKVLVRRYRLLVVSKGRLAFVPLI